MSHLKQRKLSKIKGLRSIFVFFLSLIIRSALHRGMQSSHLDKKYSIETMILKLERTTKKKEILDILERILLW